MERAEPGGGWQHAISEQGKHNLHTAMPAPANQSHGQKKRSISFFTNSQQSGKYTYTQQNATTIWAEPEHT